MKAGEPVLLRCCALGISAPRWWRSPGVADPAPACDALAVWLARATQTLKTTEMETVYDLGTKMIESLDRHVGTTPSSPMPSACHASFRTRTLRRCSPRCGSQPPLWWL